MLSIGQVFFFNQSDVLCRIVVGSSQQRVNMSKQETTVLIFRTLTAFAFTFTAVTCRQTQTSHLLITGHKAQMFPLAFLWFCVFVRVHIFARRKFAQLVYTLFILTLTAVH